MGDTNYWARRVGRRRLLRTGALGGAGIAAAALIGCGGGDDEEQTPAAVATTAATAAGGAAATATPAASSTEPQSGGTLIIPIAAEPPHLDPSGTLAYGLHTPIAPVYSRLVRTVWSTEAQHNGDFTLQPDLAEEWEVVDPQTFVFRLRQGAQWHDVAPVSGRVVDAEDIKIALDHYRSEGAHRSAYSPVAEVTTPDAQTISVKMTQPFAIFLETLSNSVRHMFPREALEREGGLEATPVIGSGAFLFDSFQRGDRFVSKRNPNYFLEGFPYLDGYEIRFIPDASTRIAGFRAGQLDYVGLGSWDAAREVLGTNPEAVHEETVPAHSTFAPAMNLNKPPFDDERVRRGMSLAMDRNATVEALFSGRGISGWGVPWVFAQDEPWTEEQLGPWITRFDPAEAKKLLSAAGYEDGFKTEMKFFAYSEVMESQIQLFQADMLANLGIEVQLAPLEYAGWFEGFTGMKWDGMAWGFQIGTSATTDDFMYSNLNSASPANYYYVKDPQIDALTDQIRGVSDLEERRALVRDVHAIDADKVYRLPAPQGNGHAMVNPRVAGGTPPLLYRAWSTYGSAALTKMWVTA